MYTLSIPIADPTAELVTYGAGAVISIERAAILAGPYSVIATLALDAAQTQYDFADTAGLATSCYRWRLRSADGLTNSGYTAVSALTGIVTLAQVRAAIRPEAPTDTDQDAYLAPFITAVTDRIHYYSGRYFLRDPETGDGTFYFSGTGTTTLWVPRGIVSVTSLSLSSLTGGAYSALGAEGTDYFLLPDVQDRPYASAPATRIELSDVGGSLFWSGLRTVKLVGALGHASVPPEIAEIALRTLVRAWRSRGAGELDVSAQMEGIRPIVSRAFSYDDRLYLESLRPAMVG